MQYDSRSMFVGGHWREGEGQEFVSTNPARDGEVVWAGRGASREQVDGAVSAARMASPAWARLDLEARAAVLERLGGAVNRRAEELAHIVTSEMGKPLRESLAEVRSLPSKVVASRQSLERLPDLALPGAPGACAWRPHGVMAVVGPFNYPLHLIHTHLAPALLAGNVCVVKASEITPLSVRIYVEMLHEAGVPDGVVNLLQGDGSVGAALVAHPGVDAVAFTGSWATGRRIAEATLEQPGKLLALEMGGKNMAIVLDDADMAQALHEVVLGACLTAGQRCTATSRLVVSGRIAGAFLPRLVAALRRVEPGDPLDDATLMGPLATTAARDRFAAFLGAVSEQEGVETLLPPRFGSGGAFASPCAHLVDGKSEAGRRLTDTELFAPHLTVEIVDGDDAAISVAEKSRYGLSLSVFTREHERFARIAQAVRSGIYNWNRSTNNASGLLPFGGLGWSGNHRPAGSASGLYAAYPVAMLEKEPGVFDPDPRFAPLLEDLLG